MSNIYEKYPHDFGHDEVFYSLRKKIYSAKEVLPVRDAAGGLLTEFCSLVEYIGGETYTSMATPPTYFSSSLKDTKDWKDSDWSALFKAITSSKGWDICRFLMISDGELARLKKEAAKRFLPYTVNTECFRCIPGDTTFEAYLQTRSSKFNANQRRCMRILEKEKFVKTQTMEFDEIASLYKVRHEEKNSAKNIEDYSVSSQFLEFLRELRAEFIKRGVWQEWGIRNTEGKLVAVCLGFKDTKGVFYMFQTAHDPNYRHMRLGAMVFETGIEKVLTDGCRYISFCSDSEYLALFAPDEYRFNRIDIYSRRPGALKMWAKKTAVKIRNHFKPKTVAAA